MGGLPGLAGFGGGAAGTSFQGPQTSQITNPTSNAQIQTAYGGVQGGLTAQQALLQALQAQQGIQNQSQVYGQLQGIASGAVNPAQAQFNQNTAANVANQAALMAGQRGASQNVGLLARQAAQQGAGIQQQAVGQEAAQQAQNQIAAIGQAGNLATAQAGQQIGQTNANVQAQQAEQQALLNAMQGYNQQQVALQSNINQANAALGGTQLQGQQGLIGGVLGSLGLGGFSAAKAEGGEITKMADGGYAGGPPFVAGSGATSEFGQFLSQRAQDQSPPESQIPYTATSSGFGKGTGPKPPKTPSGGGSGMEGQTGLPTGPLSEGIEGGGAAGAAFAQGGASDFRSGGKVNAKSQSQKAVAKGNSYSNDKIPAILSEHEIVLPRSVTLSKDPVRDAAKFVAGVIAKRKGRK